MTRGELDFARARMLVGNRELALIVCATPPELVFEGRRRCDPLVEHCTSKRPCLYHKLEREQLRFHELRALFLTTPHVVVMRRLANKLPWLRRILRRAATGWRDSRGAVRLFDQCPHGRPISETCERCAAEAAECDAL